MWGVIVNGPHTPIKLIDGMSIPKPKSEWDDFDKKMAQLNTKVMNILYYALDANKFNHISICNSAKKN